MSFLDFLKKKKSGVRSIDAAVKKMKSRDKPGRKYKAPKHRDDGDDYNPKYESPDARFKYTKRYAGKHSDEATDHYWGSLRPPIRKRMAIKDLHHGQEYTFTHKREDLIKKAKMSGQRGTVVASHTGSDGKRRHFIIDGHHGVAGAEARGRTHLRVWHVDLDKDKKTKAKRGVLAGEV